MPIESAEKVYKFLGKEMPATMSDFLVQHTTHQEKGKLIILYKFMKIIHPLQCISIINIDQISSNEVLRDQQF